MAKFHGNIGYTKSTDDGYGVWTEQSVTKAYSGDVLRESFVVTEGSKANDDTTISARFSIIADSYMLSESQYMKYIEYLGTKWKVKSINPLQRPRLIISVGGIYNGE